MTAEATTDLVIIGGGIAGMVAATRAQLAGKRVSLLEKSKEERYFCNSRVTAGVFHTCLKDILSDEKELEDAIVRVTGGHAHRGLARAVAADGKRVARWLQGHGIRFMRGSPEPHHNFVLAPPALIRIGLEFEGRAGDVALRTLEAVFVKAGGQLLRGHHVDRLIERNGKCAGVEGVRSDGAFRIFADNTIIADGGFQANAGLIARQITPAPDKILQRNTRTGAGDGLRMAEEFGAALTRLDGFYGHVMSRDAMTSDRLWPYPWYDDILTTAIIVGPDGRRFANEGNGGVYVANRIAALPDPLSAIVIFDQPVWEAGGKARSYPANPHMEKNGGKIMRAPTLAALAEQAGLPAAALENEVAIYNAALQAGTLGSLEPPRTTDRYKPLPIKTAPFYGGAACAGITYTFGGIAIDEFCRVIGKSGSPLEGLYAAGATTGGLEGGDPVGYVGGLVKSSVTGLRAAEHILGELAA